MAITKQLSIGSATKIRNTLNYVMRADKTESILVSGIECNPDTAVEEFEMVKMMHGKTDGLLGHHVIQSFKPDEVTPEVAHQIGIQLAKEIAPGYQVVVATHCDLEHIHNHLVINSVHSETGIKYNPDKAKYRGTRSVSDRLCEENGLSVIKDPKDRGWNQETYQTALRGESWKVRLMKTIDEAKSSCSTRDAFVGYMESMGYDVKWQNRNVSFRDPAHDKFVRGKTLGKDYTKEAIEDAFERRVDQETPDTDRSDGRTFGETIEPSRDVAWDERRNEPSDAQSDPTIDRTATNDPSRIGDNQSFLESRMMERLGRIIRTDGQGEDAFDEQMSLVSAVVQIVGSVNRTEEMEQAKRYREMRLSGEPMMFERLSEREWSSIKDSGIAAGFREKDGVLAAYLEKDRERIRKQLETKVTNENSSSPSFRMEHNKLQQRGSDR
jgi:Relaxase/Mobilisation nuclease domain